MNLLFANLFWEYGEDLSKENMNHLQFPTGLAIIAAEIYQKRNDELYVIDNYISNANDSDILKFIEVNNIDVILLSAYLGNYQYRFLKKFVNEISSDEVNCKIIIGGPLASTVPKTLLENISSKDEEVILVIGEGEKTIIDLLNNIDSKGDLSNVNGIGFIKNKKYIQTRPQERIMRLDEHPYPAYDLFNISKYVSYVKETNRCWELCTSRGCYGRCVYCKRVFGNSISMKSPEYIVKEMEDFFIRYGIKRFNFVDDNFLNSTKQINDFYNSLKNSEYDFVWRFQGRADRFTPALANKLVEVGLYDVSFGIESGSPTILKEMNKKIDIEIAKKNLLNLPKNLDTHASFIIGMPSESHKTIEQTVKFIEDTRIKNINAGILTVFPGTPLYEKVRKLGIIMDEDDYCNRLGPVYVKPYINLTSYSDHQLLLWQDLVSKAV
ncbi:B12-binding domain-containing radical SAM protein [Methanocalculus sp. MC3]